MSDHLLLISKEMDTFWVYGLLFVLLIVTGYLLYEKYKHGRCLGQSCQIRSKYQHDLETANGELEDALHKHNLALRSMNFGLVYIDKDFMVQWEMTDRIQQLVTKHRYVPGKHCYETIDLEREACNNCVFKAAVKAQKPAQHLVSTDGMIFEITATPVYDNNGTELLGGLLRIEEVTEKLKVDSMLRDAKERAEEANRLKTAFLANMSHEIRTPLNAIVGFSDMISQTDDAETKAEYAKIISTNNTLLLRLIDDVFDLAKIEAGTMGFYFAPIEVNEVMDNVYVRASAKNHNSDLQILFTDRELNCTIETDRKRLIQVLENLVDNALKFTSQGSITLGYRLDKQTDEILFFVKDTGIGIASDKLEEVFERFVKLNSFVNGTGLGLSLCRTIAERLGGTIGAESKEGEGSCFWFRLPVKRKE